MPKPIIRLVTCGSVDDGKSTLIGRLLVETDSIPHDTISSARSMRRSGSTVEVGEIDFSLLTDGLEAEREQGITIDVAYRSMSLLNGCRLIIADAPGHEQYTRNMVVAASRADVALVLVDASRGIRTQTLRHLTICSLMGIERIAIVINKLDAVGYSESIYEKIKEDLSEPINRLEIKDFEFIPVSALVGGNIVFKSIEMPWYSGPTLLEYIQYFDKAADSKSRARFGIQMISRAENFRGVSGTLIKGEFSVGDEVITLPTRGRARIAQILTFDGGLEKVEASRAVTLVLEPDIDATRGDVIELANDFTEPADRFKATVVWLGEPELIHSRSYLLINGSTQVPAMVTKIRHRIDIQTGKDEVAESLKMNEIGVVEIATDALIALSTYKSSRESGNFILVDRSTMNTVGAGMVEHVMRRSSNITKQEYEINQHSRSLQKNQRARVVWLTGLPGSGKSTIANALEKQLFAMGLHSYVLDGDNIRLGLSKDLGFIKEDRAENVRRVSEVARLMCDAGLIVIAALISPFAVDRDQARSLFGQGEFLEVWIDTSADVCTSRDPKGLYKKAAAGSIPNLTGAGGSYEPPEHAELVLDGTAPVDENVKRLIQIIL